MATPSDTVEISAELAAPSRSDAASAARATLAVDEIVVVDDLPRPMPVVPPEINVIETYLSALLDGLLGKISAKARSGGNTGFAGGALSAGLDGPAGGTGSVDPGPKEADQGVVRSAWLAGCR